MNRIQIKSQLEKLVEEEIPSSETSMWPAVKKLIENKKQSSLYEGVFMKRPVYTRIAISFSIVLIVGSAILLATPQGRSLAQEIVSFFTRSESDYVPYDVLQLPTPSLTETPDIGFTFTLTVAEAAELAGFEVLEPTWLPEVLRFYGVSYQPDHNIVRIAYQHILVADMGNGLVLQEERFQTTDNCKLCGLVGASAEIEQVQVGEVTGQYVVGVWKFDEGGNAIWENEPWIQTLRWQVGGIAFDLLFMGPPGDLTKEDMIAIAESIK